MDATTKIDQHKLDDFVALGAQAGPRRLGNVPREAGFGQVHVAVERLSTSCSKRAGDFENPRGDAFNPQWRIIR